MLTTWYQCPHCDERFHKSNHLRDHIALSHMPAGTKSYSCPYEGCGASFAIRHQLKAHERTHDCELLFYHYLTRVSHITERFKSSISPSHVCHP